jgi:divalent metal cation (Fe/Co/Zn/Cd) transporter
MSSMTSVLTVGPVWLVLLVVELDDELELDELEELEDVEELELLEELEVVVVLDELEVDVDEPVEA